MIRSATLVLLVAAVLALLSVVQAASLEARSGHSGHATFYNVDKSGKPSCGSKADSDDLVAALSKKRMPHGHGKPCGEKIKIKGPNGHVTVKVVDTCPECKENDIDLSPKAFKKIAKKKDGKVKITWSFD